MNMMSMNMGGTTPTFYRTEDNKLINSACIEMIEEVKEKGNLHPVAYVLHMSSGNPIYITPNDYNKIISDIEVK